MSEPHPHNPPQTNDPPATNDKLPRFQIDWRLNLAILRRSMIIGVLVLYGLITALGMLRAYVAELPEDDRSAELSYLHAQLNEERTRTERLQSELDAFEKRPEIRMSTIRNELGMLKASEKFVLFR